MTKNAMQAMRGVYDKIPRPRNKIATHPISINGIMIKTKQKETKNPMNSIVNITKN